MMIDVAVGVVFREDGAVLIGQRLQGKPYAGWWEFPGGKFEAGEDAGEALARELDEELGIKVLESRPWVVREHVYEHAHVRLHFRRVVRWHGEVTSREGQDFVWRLPAAIDVGPLLPAAIAPIGWLGLPAEYAISDAGTLGIDGFLESLSKRLHESGQPLQLLQLREPELPVESFETLFDQVCDRIRGGRVRLLVNSRHPPRFWRLAAERASGGVHYTARDLTAAAARGEGMRLPLQAASCHQPADLASAGAFGIDLAVYGPVCRTLSHPDVRPLGWLAFQDAIALTPVPVYGLGGLRREDLEPAMRSGAHGIAMQRSAWLD
jgi:8-oxo-dGTP diphosphatase